MVLRVQENGPEMLLVVIGLGDEVYSDEGGSLR
jgi:hypothetical protein